MNIPKELIYAIEQTWQRIAFDIPGDAVSAEVVVELCCDADRLRMNGHASEADIATDLIREHGYEKFLTTVANALPFDEYEAGGAA
jgi:hypothetical protein